MPKTANATDAAIADLSRRLEQLVAAARKEGRAEALAEVRSLVGGAAGSAEAPARRGPGRPRKDAAAPAAAKPKKPRKNPWASMTPEQKAARVKKMLAGRGLKPKAERKAARTRTARRTKKAKS